MIKNSIKKIIKFIKKINASLRLKKILIKNNNDKIILIGSPLHGNIGDHAISIAEMRLLKKIKDKTVIEIPGEYYNLCTKKIIKYVKGNDIILITGGGFIGNIWMVEENMVKSILKNFASNKTIILPQTFFFTNDTEGSEELKELTSIINNHQNLHIFLREEKSFNFCRDHFKSVNNIELIPDMVISLNYSNANTERKNILFCLREDKEKSISNQDLNQILSKTDSLKIKVNKTTTVVQQKIKIKDRKRIFENKLLEFSQSKLVITDRLHGMLFAAITGTPCIALNNISGKVEGVYKWISHLDYIKFVNNLDNISELIKSLINLNNTKYTADKYYEKQFDKIVAIIK